MKLGLLTAAFPTLTLDEIADWASGNRFEALVGDRAGQYSIRINDQWRICFTWTAAGAADVEITDYH
jgi:proteic killer suppression protein